MDKIKKALTCLAYMWLLAILYLIKMFVFALKSGVDILYKAVKTGINNVKKLISESDSDAIDNI